MAQLSLSDVLAQFRDAATSNRELGDRFERLIARYLELDPIYAERFSNVWLWNEWPQKGKVGDVGIDLVAEERATLGAAQSRLELASSTLQIEYENLSSAISRIRDVDVAEESTNYARYNILVQSGTAMLAQANQQPQAVLKLLG